MWLSNLLRGVVFVFHVLPVLDRVQWFPVVLSSYCLQVVLGILWGTKAFVMDDGGEMRRCRGKLDAADATYLRCLMRRYGWEKIDKEVEVCYWSECVPSARYGNKKCLHFAWFLLTRLLHPRNTPALQAMRSLHDPVTVRELCDSRTSVISVSLLYVLYSFLISIVVVVVVVVVGCWLLLLLLLLLMLLKLLKLLK